MLPRVPRDSRIHAAKIFNEVIRNVMETNDDQAWLRMAKMPSSCFGRPKHGGKKSGPGQLARSVKSQIQSFREGVQLEPLEKTQKPERPLAKLVSEKISAGDIRGAVRIVSSDDKLLECSEETFQKLQERHPAPHKDSTLPPAPSKDPIVPLDITAEDVKQAIKTFPRGSSGGRDGLTPQHVRDMTEESVGQDGAILLETIAKFINNIVLAGQVPE